MKHRNEKANEQSGDDASHRLWVSLKTIALQLDADQGSVRRWLRGAGIQAKVLGNGRNAAIRFEAAAVDAWLKSRQSIS